MFRLLMALLLSILICNASPALRAAERDRDRKPRELERQRGAKRNNAARDDDQRDQRDRRERRRKRRPDRPARDVRPDERPAEPAPQTPEKAEPKSTEPQPEPAPKEPQPSELLPEPAEKGTAEKSTAETPKGVESAMLADDFALQGEYLGQISSGSCAGKVGLQVVALGDGKFEAYLLQGGLPGNGWLRGSPRAKLSGQRDGARLALRGDAGSIELDGLLANVVDAEGHARGELKKVLRRSPTMGAAPALGAKVLFNGKSTEAFQTAKLTDDGLLGVGALTKEPVGDFRMHLEFRTPFEPSKRGQGRGNSGIYIQERYEVQVLDSFGLEGDAGECGGLYRQRKPDLNLCLPPMSWQTYDIYFTAARFDAQGNKSASARITVFHNGIAVHNNVEVTDKTGAGQKEGPDERPIRFQDHGNAVVYRNIWLAPGEGRVVVDDVECAECW